jgi:MFS family permease
LVADAKQGWHYLRARPGLPALLVFFGVTSFGIGFVEVILPHLVDAFAEPAALNLVFVAAVLGMTGTGVAMTIWGGPRRRVAGLLGFTLLLAGAMIVGALRPNIVVIAVAAVGFLGSTSIIVGNFQTVLCTKVEPHMLGRVMGWKNSFYGGLLQLGDILAGVSGVLVIPLVGEERVRSSVVAAVVGDGPGRGFAVLMLAMGLLLASCVVIAHRHRPLRDLEDVLPDVTPEDLALATARR